MFRKALLASVFLTASVAPASAHHSFAAFFSDEKIVKITGKVTSFRFANPHGTIALQVPAENGGTTEWRVETNAPVVLVRRGWSQSSLKAGDTVTIEGWLARDGKHYLRLRQAWDEKGNRIGAAPFDTSG